MPTSRDLAVASILDSESIIDRITNEDEADNFVNNIQVRNFPVFSPPGARPNRAATTKTKLKADAKALKTRKAQADEDKKRATAERRHEAQAKKREKAIVAAEVRADKAAAKAESLRIQFESVKANDVIIKTPTRGVGSHVPKKSKGVEGEVALLTPTYQTAIAKSPQRKGSSPKKRMMVQSPPRPAADEELSGAVVEYQNSSSEESESSSSMMSGTSGRGRKAVFSGGRRHMDFGRGSGGRGGRKTNSPGLRSAESSDCSSSSSSSAVGTDSESSLSAPKRSTGENYRSQGSHSSASESSGLPSHGDDMSLSVARKTREFASYEDQRSDEDSGEEERVPSAFNTDRCQSSECAPTSGSPGNTTSVDQWPGLKTTPLLSQFVALHFQGDWQAYVQFELWAQERKRVDPDGEIYIGEWHARDTDDGGGKPSAVEDERVRREVSKGGRKIGGWREEEDSRGNDPSGADGRNPEGKRTAGARSGEMATDTPQYTRQLFPDTSSPPVREKEITWSLTTSGASPQSEKDGPPPFQTRGTPIKRTTNKQEKLLAQLNAAEQSSAIARAQVNALRSGTISLSGKERPMIQSPDPQAVNPLSGKLPDSNSPASTPGSNKSLGSRGAGALLTDIATLRRDRLHSNMTSPISDGTPSFLTDSSMSATTISTSARSSLYASKYPSVPHGNISNNDSTTAEDRDMFSMDHRIPLGEAGHFWYLTLGFDWLADEDSRGTMLAGMSSVMETFPLMIDGFELHPLAKESSLPFLTSNQVEEGFPQSAIMMFRYFHVKNKMNTKGASQAASEPSSVSSNKFDDEAEFKPSNTLWGTVKVRAKENVKEAVESLSWDFNNTGIQVRWKPHQSAESSAQVQIFCCPNVFEREGLTEELIYNMKLVEKKMCNKGQLSMDLYDEPLPAMHISWRHNSQGKGRNKRERKLSLNDLEAFGQNGCQVLSIETEEGTWSRFGPLWRMANKMCLVRPVFGRKAVMVVLYGGKPTESDRNTIQRLRRCNVIYSYSMASVTLPFVETIHKRVEVRMEDETSSLPYKFTDLSRELLELLVPLEEGDPRAVKGKVFAFDSCVPNVAGQNSGSVTITFRSDCKYSCALARKIKKNPPSWWFGYWRRSRKYNLPTVQSLMESFDTNQAIFSQYSTFDTKNLTVEAEFGDTDEQLESMESDLGIDQGWIADIEEGYGGRHAVEGHQEALEKTLRDRIEDVDDAARSGASRRTNFSQSTGNSTIHSTGAARMAFNHEERALRNVELINANSGLQNELDVERAKLTAVMAQLQFLQSQSAPQQLEQMVQDEVQEDSPMEIRGGGSDFPEVADTGGQMEGSEQTVPAEFVSIYGGGQGNCSSPGAFTSQVRGLNEDLSTLLGGVVEFPWSELNAIRGGEAEQDPESISPEGWTEFLHAAEIHWKWPPTDPQNPRSAREPPPGHPLNIYTMTNSEAYEYATKVMGLGEGGTLAFYEFVCEIREEQATWEARAENAIRKDRLSGKSPYDEARRCHQLYNDEGLWILTQRELAKHNPSSTPQEICSITQKGYCSAIEAGVARDVMSALALLEYNNRIELILLAELEEVRKVSYVEFVIMANLKATRDELQQLQETIWTSPASCYFRHDSYHREHGVEVCADQKPQSSSTRNNSHEQGNYECEALQRLGLRVRNKECGLGGGLGYELVAAAKQHE